MRKYWINGDGNPQRISEMSTSYIKNCLRQLAIWKNNWGNYTLEELTEEEMEHKDNVGKKAWFLINGADYEETFLKELKERDEE